MKVPLMVALLAIAGLSDSGCSQPRSLPRSLPPAASIPRPRLRSQPELSRVVPPPRDLPSLPPRTVPPALSIPANPWRPDAPAREWRYVVIHHTATDHGSVESIHETHLAREWLGIGYHFVIGNGQGMDDGAIEHTFRWREQMHGAHAGDEEYNQHGIGVALIGNFEEQPPSPAQLDAVKRLIGVLAREYGITGENIIGHSTVKATDCPGKYFPLDEIRRLAAGAPPLAAAKLERNVQQ